MEDERERKKKVKDEKSLARYRARFEALKREEEKITAERQKLEGEYHERLELLKRREEEAAKKGQELEEERHHLDQTIIAFNLRLAAEDEEARHEKLVELEGELRKLSRHRDSLSSMIAALHKTLEAYPVLDREIVTHLVKMLLEEIKKQEKEDVSLSKSSMKSTFVQVEEYLTRLVLLISAVLQSVLSRKITEGTVKAMQKMLSESFDELIKILYGNIQYKFTSPLKFGREVQSESAAVKSESVVNSNMTEAKLADVLGFFERSVAAAQPQAVPEPLLEVPQPASDESTALKGVHL